MASLGAFCWLEIGRCAGAVAQVVTAAGQNVQATNALRAGRGQLLADKFDQERSRREIC